MSRNLCFYDSYDMISDRQPWIPLLSLIPPTPTPFLSLPCCTHTLDSTFTRAVFTPPPHPHSPPGGLDEGLEKGQSKYKAYLMYLGHQGLMCGWEWEKEGLRVPSTRGWGIVGMSCSHSMFSDVAYSATRFSKKGRDRRLTKATIKTTLWS